MILMHEEMAMSPREFPTIATLIVIDRRFSGGDENFDRMSELAGYLEQNRRGIAWARRHGLWHEIWRNGQNELRLGAPENLAGWACLGAIYIDPDKAKSELRKRNVANLCRKTLEAQIQQELDDFSGWLRGDTWLVMNESGDDIYFGTKAECEKFIKEELLTEAPFRNKPEPKPTDVQWLTKYIFKDHEGYWFVTEDEAVLGPYKAQSEAQKAFDAYVESI